MFFCLSGFLITWILAKEIDATRAVDLKRFYWRRAIRLLPAYVTALVAAMILSLYEGNHIRAVSYDAFFFITYSFNIFYARNLAFAATLAMLLAPAWSLCIEEQFYFCWSVIVKYLKAHRALYFVLGSMAVLAIYRIWLHQHLLAEGLSPQQIGDRFYFGTETRIEAIFAGCAAALALRNDKVFTIAHRFLSIRFMPFLIGVGTAVIFLLATLHGHENDVSIETWGYSITSLMLALWIVSVLFQPKSWTSRVLAFRPMIFLGRISYGLYLLHYLVIHVFSHLVGIKEGSGSVSQRLFIWISTMTVSIAVATAHYYGVELPLLKTRKKVAFIAAKPDLAGAL